MREKYRKSIASLNKFPQFTTMNVIDGQAGLISYTSLIFYSLTIDNILNIIVLLILTGVTIATLTGENGILTQANEAKTSNAEGEVSDKFALLANEWAIEKNTGNKNLGEFLNGKITEGKLSSVEDNGDGTYTIKLNGYQTIIDQNGKISSAFNPEEWDKTATSEDCFIWGSDTEGEEGYDVIIGYTEKLELYTKLIIPSRCTKIDLFTSYTNASSQSSRSFCSSIKTIELPRTVMEIGAWAFAGDGEYGFGDLESATIPESVTRIGDNAFHICRKLSSITIPSSITSMGSCVFLGCSSLRSVEIQDGVTSIGDWAFSGCTNLNDITIPISVTSIGLGTFSGWTSSQTINIQGYTSTPSGWDSDWNRACSATINWGQ